MQPVNRPDPAPSRLRYRMQRLMLTPLFRVVLRVGLPMAAVLGAGGIYLADQERREAIITTIQDYRRSFEERPEFMVKLLAIDGASNSVSEDIRDILPLDFPVSSFDLDLDAMRATVTGLDAVQSASLRVRQGGVLQVDVTERVPVMVWRTQDGLELLDADGVLVGPLLARDKRPDLPLIAGAGADRNVAEALELVAAAGPLTTRLRGLVRVGERRWDVVLNRNQRILLPETDAVQALERVIAMHQAVDMLSRDLVTVDLRLSNRPTVRMTSVAVEELWRMKSLEFGEE
ncbi:cell division protein FtsQ [Primorskyibacter flagellatus]|uniref:Cell division protein FtsQ n=3 Tax=Primorskyibacter flagellatus TaxID=1387277 RepID=A0A1W2CUB3_9RHOB|nr:cell division protein FtsQ [Primorskyibacter flagellatus]